MRGSVGWQCTQVLTQSDILQIGESKHEAKEEARAEGATTWAEIGAEIGIYSYGTADAYKDTWCQFMTWAKEELGLKDIEKTTGAEISAYLEHRIEEGVAHATFARDCAALGKLETALNMYSEKFDRGNEYSFRGEIREAAKEGHNALEKADPHRAYENPHELVAAIDKTDHALGAKIQLEGGARIHEMSLIKEAQLKGLSQDSVTGEKVGVIEVQGKGGKVRDIQVSEATYNQLANYIAERGGRFGVDKAGYRDSLMTAAAMTDQTYTGSHGLRWSYAQERMSTAQEKGQTYEQAMSHVSHEMGHTRADITEHYLR